MTGQEIKCFRESIKLTQKEMALLLGYKEYNTIQKWEYGLLKVPKLVERVCFMIESLEEKEKENFIQKFMV